MILQGAIMPPATTRVNKVPPVLYSDEAPRFLCKCYNRNRPFIVWEIYININLPNFVYQALFLTSRYFCSISNEFHGFSLALFYMSIYLFVWVCFECLVMV